jgi:carbonic anhydrase
VTPQTDPTKVLHEVLDANGAFVETFESGQLPAPPSRGLAVLTCMDARIVPLEVFGLRTGDAHILRNAGGRVTDDALRSLLVSTHVMGVRAVAVVHHTECGMARATDDELRQQVEAGSGADAGAVDFLAIRNPDADLRGDVERIQSSPLLPPGTVVQGFEYDVHTGRLRRVV